MRLTRIICTCFILLNISMNASDCSKSSLKRILKTFGSNEFKKSLKQFIAMDDKEQKEIYKLCKNASKEAWEIGFKISEQEYRENQLLKAKVLATTLKATEFYNHGYSAEEAASLAKQTVEITYVELQDSIE